MKILTGLNFGNLNISKPEIEKNKMPGREILPETTSSLAKKYSGISLEEFQKMDTVLNIYSHILGETIYFASNKKAIDKCGTISGVVYTVEELKTFIIKEVKESELKAIHKTKKKVFDGGIL